MDVKETLDTYGKPMYTVVTPKFNTEFYVKKSVDGYATYVILNSNSTVAEQLSGKYSTIDTALSALTSYIKNAKESKTVRRDNNSKESVERRTKQVASKI